MGDAQGTVALVAIVDDIDFSTQIVIAAADRVMFGFADPALTDASFDATYELVDPGLGEVVGSAVADADLTATGERLTDVDWFDASRLSVIGKRLAADGTLTITIDGATAQVAMDAESCDAGDVLVQQMEKMSRR